MKKLEWFDGDFGSMLENEQGTAIIWNPIDSGLSHKSRRRSFVVDIYIRDTRNKNRLKRKRWVHQIETKKGFRTLNGAKKFANKRFRIGYDPKLAKSS